MIKTTGKSCVHQWQTMANFSSKPAAAVASHKDWGILLLLVFSPGSEIGNFHHVQLIREGHG